MQRKNTEKMLSQFRAELGINLPNYWQFERWEAHISEQSPYVPRHFADIPLLRHAWMRGKRLCLYALCHCPIVATFAPMYQKMYSYGVKERL